MTIYHKHHIVPKHMGGSDHPSNIITLTIEEHALAHKQLYEKYGKPQDYAAWKGLSGAMNSQEIIKYLQSEGSKIMNKREIANGTHPFLGDRNPSRIKVKNGTHHFQQNIGNRPADIAQRKLVENKKHHWQSTEHANIVGQRSRAAIEQKTHPFSKNTKCPHCEKEGQVSAMKRWHFENCPNASS